MSPLYLEAILLVIWFVCITMRTSQNANNIQQRVFTTAKKAISDKQKKRRWHKIDVLLGQN